MAAKQALRRKEADRGGDATSRSSAAAGTLVAHAGASRPAQQPVGGDAGRAAGGIDEAARDAGVRAVVIAAKGPAFCAGHDLKELSSRRSDADGGRAYYAHAHAPVRRA